MRTYLLSLLNDLKEAVEKLLTDHKDAGQDEYDTWEPALYENLLDMFNTHGDKLIKVLGECIFTMDPKDAVITMLFYAILPDMKFASSSTMNVLLDIFDNHPDSSIRHVALLTMFGQGTFIDELEIKYDDEKDVNIKLHIGNMILSKILKKTGLSDHYAIPRGASGGNPDMFINAFNLDAGKNTKKDLQLVNFLIESKYTHNTMISRLENLAKKIKNNLSVKYGYLRILYNPDKLIKYPRHGSYVDKLKSSLMEEIFRNPSFYKIQLNDSSVIPMVLAAHMHGREKVTETKCAIIDEEIKLEKILCPYGTPASIINEMRYEFVLDTDKDKVTLCDIIFDSCGLK